jgi:5,10-methylenetetrahydromethanopterin reductase
VSGGELGLGFQSDKSWRDYERLALAAEEYGFDVVAVFGDLYFGPPVPALLAMARATNRIRLGPACLNPFTLHPVEIAGQIAALDEASGGRAFCGLARGTWLADLGIEQAGAVDAVVEAAAIVRALLAGEGEAVGGSRFVLPAGVRLRPTPLRRAVPILVGTWGPRLARQAATFADELKVGGSANPEMVAVARSWLAPDPAEREHTTDVKLVLGAVTVVDEDGDAARRRAREEVAMYLDVVAGLDPTVEVDPALLAELHARVGAGDRAAAGALVTRTLLDRFAFAGTPAEVAEHAVAVLAAGADRLEFGTPHGLSDAAGVALLGAKVLPAVRAEIARS